jgi:hypothetical protein
VGAVAVPADAMAVGTVVVEVVDCTVVVVVVSAGIVVVVGGIDVVVVVDGSEGSVVVVVVGMVVVVVLLLLVVVVVVVVVVGADTVVVVETGTVVVVLAVEPEVPFPAATDGVMVTVVQVLAFFRVARSDMSWSSPLFSAASSDVSVLAAVASAPASSSRYCSESPTAAAAVSLLVTRFEAARWMYCSATTPSDV